MGSDSMGSFISCDLSHEVKRIKEVCRNLCYHDISKNITAGYPICLQGCQVSFINGSQTVGAGSGVCAWGGVGALQYFNCKIVSKIRP